MKTDGLIRVLKEREQVSHEFHQLLLNLAYTFWCQGQDRYAHIPRMAFADSKACFQEEPLITNTGGDW